MENGTTRSALQKAASMLTAARKEALPSHPSPDDLAAYHARALTPSRSDRIQDHLSFCRDCSRVVMNLAPEIGAARHYSPLSDRHVSEAWERFVQHLAPEGSAESLPSESALPSRGRSAWSAWAALLIAAVGVASFSIWILRSLPQPEANVDRVFLRSEEDQTRSDGREVVQPASNAGSLLLVLQASWADDPFPRYGLTLESEEENSQRALWGSDDLRKESTGEFTVSFPPKFLPPGHYRLRLFGLAGDQKTPLAVYRIQINHPPVR